MKIGLTGGIASGKSMLSAYAKALGIQVIDADVVSREVLDLYPEILTYLEETYGDLVVQEGKLLRRALGRIIFQDPEKKKAYLSVIMPKILWEIKKRLEETQEPWVLLDAPLLFEEGLDKEVDVTVVVWVSEETQERRLMERDGYRKEEAKARIAAQWSLGYKKTLADHVIDNEGTKEESQEAFLALLTSLGFCSKG